jgi:hypothetical protein
MSLLAVLSLLQEVKENRFHPALAIRPQAVSP